MVQSGHVFTDPEILKVATNNGWTVAHEMAMEGVFFHDKTIQCLAINEPLTTIAVSHFMALRGYRDFDDDMLDMVAIKESSHPLSDNQGRITIRSILSAPINTATSYYVAMNCDGHLFSEIFHGLKPPLFNIEINDKGEIIQ